jgi:hypothetical protein
MRITKLTLANFRSFGKEQTIEFAPLTLLFGPNSVGKSTVLMALFYVQQILAKGQCDPQRIDAMGERFVGGFRHLVHGKRLDETLRIGIEFELGEKLGSSYSDVGELVAIEVGPIGELIGLAPRASTMSVLLDISWSFLQETAYVSRYKVGFNGTDLAEITSDSGLKQPMITGLNYQHPLLDYEELHEWVEEQIEKGHAIHPSVIAHVYETDGEEGSDLEGLAFSEEALQSEFHELTQIQPMASETSESTSVNVNSDIAPGSYKTLGIKGFAGALPKLGRSLATGLSLSDDMRTRVVEEILSDIVVAPLDNLLQLLNESLCIGPLRHISDATYQANPYPEQKDWYSGRACWDELSTCDLLRDTVINEWLTGSDKLNLGYKLVYKTSQGSARYISPSRQFGSLDDVVAVSDALGKGFEVTYSKENLDENPDADQQDISPLMLEALRERYDSTSSLYLGEFPFKDTKIALWDCQNDIEVTAADIGVGVSQLLPLLVASAVVKNGLIACEQPELHVHPRVQVAIGDMLLNINEKTNFLIETHSEHLVLRLLRRIRESANGRQPEAMVPVLPKDVSVIYLEPTDQGVQVKRLVITEDGDFEEHWPGGFFEERDEELF